MTTGANPYVVPSAVDINAASDIVEATIIASHAMVDIGNGVMAHAETFNGGIPGPVFRLNVGDTLIVRLRNQLPHATGIHWHGIEMANAKDGSPFTQKQIENGYSYLYKLRIPRAGLFWYHPHHHASTNQVFKGLYGGIIVTDPVIEAGLVGGVLPAATDTLPLVLSDVTVCKAVGMNDAQTYDLTLPWAGGPTLPNQPGPTPATLCQLPTALDEMGNPALANFGEGDIPNIQQLTGARTNEGQTVLTNGMNVGGRAGSPSAPGAVSPTASKYPVLSGQGLRLQIFNTSTIRYFRLRLTRHDGTQVQLFRIGGEGGLLNNPVLEGGAPPGGFNTKFGEGEILLPAGSRADVVAAIPAGLPIGSVLTMWTLDFERTGGGFANLPTVPVMHLEVTGAVAGPAYTISTSTVLRSGGNVVPSLGPVTGTLLDPSLFAPPKPGLAAQNIQITQSGTATGIDNVAGTHDIIGPYTSAAHMATARYAKVGDVLELTVQNTTLAHHPFHLHGFSIQPKELTSPAATGMVWPYDEFRDNIDIPAGFTLRFRVHIDSRPLVDDASVDGALGRWLLHCHIFFHAHLGMISELIVTGADGSERPYVDVNGSWAYAPSGMTATRTGTYAHPDGLAVVLSASLGTVVDTGSGTWSWSYSGPDQTTHVYIKATDTEMRSDQTVFRLKIGGMDDGADNGDPHIHTVDGTRYDFQAVGEFTLLRDFEEGLEIQGRQTPVPAANPITDPHTGLHTCVSINTAVAARIGKHTVSYQPWGDRGTLQLFVDGKPADVPRQGLDLGEHRLTTQEVAGGVIVRVDCANHTVLIISPHFWNSYGVWYLNVTVAHTQADEGIMGRIAAAEWLPVLPDGRSLGPMPTSLHDRYVALYRTFADAWRVTDATSLFVYQRGTSTGTFTDRKWPAEKPPCELLPQFEVPGGTPPLRGMEIEKAEKVCRRVTIDGLHQDCVFDVATTGDKQFAEGYERVQALRMYATAVQITADKPRSRPGEELLVTALVRALFKDNEETPRGTVSFVVDGHKAGPAVKLDERCSASIVLHGLKTGTHRIRAEYSGGGRRGHQSSSSANLFHVVGRFGDQPQREDQLVGHTLEIHSAHGKKHVEVELDVKTARRILAFVNSANRPEDLMHPPEALTHMHVEYRKRGYPEKHPPSTGEHAHGEPDHTHGEPAHEKHTHGEDGHGECAECVKFADHMHAGCRECEKLADHLDVRAATEILVRRNQNPIYGFIDIKDLLDLDWLRDLLIRWWYYFSRASKGEWTGPFTIPGPGFDRPVHAAVLRTGKVLFFGLPTGKDSWLWTPSGPDAGTTAPTANKPTDSLFCAGHSFLSDGRLLVVGGGGDGTGPRHNHGWIFDPGSDSWTRTAGNGTPANGDMNFYRWYPTLVTLGDEPGRVLVVSGDDTSGNDVQQMEIYFETSDRFELVWGPGGVGDTSANHSFPQIYPALNLLPGGEVFYTPTGWHSGGCSGASDYPAAKPSGFFDFSSTAPVIKASWTNVGTQDAAAEDAIDRVKGMAVLFVQPSYPFVQVMVVGGGQDPVSATSFQMINLSTLAPKWGPPVALPDALARVNVNLVALPDGSVFVSGGRPVAGTPATGGACWIYDPVGMTWQECDALARRRAYHSVAVLLLDGRVATAGNECPAETTYEVFTPPYLFASDGSLAPRPVITSLPAQVHHGHTFTIQTPSPSTISKVVLVRPMAVTHQTDSEQRVVQLSFVTSGPTALTATAPNGWHPHGLAPRGWYMVFLVDNQGVPSVGQFMHLH